MNQAQEQAKQQLTTALQSAMEAGLFKALRYSIVRTMVAGEPRTVQCIVMAENEHITECIETRISSPTFQELLDIDPRSIAAQGGTS